MELLTNLSTIFILILFLQVNIQVQKLKLTEKLVELAVYRVYKETSQDQVIAISYEHFNL